MSGGNGGDFGNKMGRLDQSERPEDCLFKDFQGQTSVVFIGLEKQKPVTIPRQSRGIVTEELESLNALALELQTRIAQNVASLLS